MNDLTLNERSTGSLISSSPPPRHMTKHMHPPRTFNTQIFTISNLCFKLYTNTTMHRHPPHALYTHHNIYSLKLLPLTLYQHSIQQKRITIIDIKKNQFQRLRERWIYTYPNGLWWESLSGMSDKLARTGWPSNEREDGSSDGPDSQGARRTYRATPPPPAAPPPTPPGTFHYGSKMYLTVSRTQSHLFPGQPLGCTGVIALCARVPSCLQSVADWAPVKSLVHYYFVMKWPKCSLKYAWWFLPYHLEQTDSKFKYSLEPGEGLRAGTVGRVSERSYNTTKCPLFIIWHISIAHFDNILFEIIAWEISDLETTGLMMLLFLQKIQWVNYVPYPQICKKLKIIKKKYSVIFIHLKRYQPCSCARIEHNLP